MRTPSTVAALRQAPWFIVPADKKWFRNLAVAETVRNALMPFKKTWLAQLGEVGREMKKELEEYRRSAT